ncbi:MAG: hypothetical protein Q7R39_06970 [Dehalococcoidia bacterium]|nr:hypothetical protein [Dehalococcoidia bacterium]
MDEDRDEVRDEDEDEDEDGVELGGPLVWLSRNKTVSGVIFVLLVALLTQTLGLWQSPVSINGGRLAPAASTEAFARGQTTFDAQLIWGSLSDDFTQALSDQGQEVSSIQSQLDTLKTTGIHYTGISYLGGHTAKNGESYYVYVFSRTGTDASAPEEDVPYVFVVNRSGKIDRIE